MDKNVGADVYLYGYGCMGETRTIDDDGRNGKLYFNAMWGVSLHMVENSHCIIPKIDI